MKREQSYRKIENVEKNIPNGRDLAKAVAHSRVRIARQLPDSAQVMVHCCFNYFDVWR